LYMVSGQVNWDKGPAGVRTILVTQNSNIALVDESTDISTPGPTVQNFGIMQELTAGDTLQVLAGQTTGGPTDLTSGSEFSCIFVPASEAVSQPPYNDVVTSGSNPNVATRTLVADADMSTPRAVSIQSDGG